MNSAHLVRAEIRKLTSTRMPLAFFAVLTAIAVTNAAAVVFGTDMDGSKAFIATGIDQQSLIAFAANALMISGFFGAIAVAREYGHNTVVPTYLATPRRHRAVLAQFTAIAVGGAALGFVGTALTAVAVVASLPTTEFGFMVSGSGVARVLLAASFSGAVGAVLGAGIGALVRNTGGAVTGVVVALIIAPPLAVQLAGGAASWVPNTLANVVSGVGADVGSIAALVVLCIWAAVPATIGLISVERRDVV